MPAMTTPKHYIPVKALLPRPPLPIEHANPHIKHMDLSKPPPVKFQEIIREGQATIVARVKVQTPTGHAFILRRLDTGAISLTTMFRAAFPTAGDEAERAESNWVKQSYEVVGANRSGKARFAGTWVNPDVALCIAEQYALGPLLAPLAEANPDPNFVYRKSSKTQQTPTPTVSPATSKNNFPTPSPKEPGPGPTKRRRETSPTRTPIAPSSATTTNSQVPAVTPPSSTAKSGSRGTTNTPATRRSARLKSPTPSGIPVPTKTPKTARKVARQEPITPMGSDETSVDDDAAEAARATEPNMHDDIREQQELIANLKAQRDAERRAREEEDIMEEEPAAASPQKRVREEEAPLKFDFKEPQPDVADRTVATNRRVKSLNQMPPERKALAWGTVAFATSVGIISMIPTLQSYFF